MNREIQVPRFFFSALPKNSFLFTADKTKWLKKRAFLHIQCSPSHYAYRAFKTADLAENTW